MKKSKIIFSFNAPAVLCFALLSLGALGLSMLSGGASDLLLFSVYKSSFLHPLTYARLLCHVMGHTSFALYVSNMALILALGPIVEERYGSLRLLQIIAAIGGCLLPRPENGAAAAYHGAVSEFVEGIGAVLGVGTHGAEAVHQ